MEKIKRENKRKESQKGGQSGRKIQRDCTKVVIGSVRKSTNICLSWTVGVDTNKELSIDDIKVACKLHFTDRVGSNMECDILAGEQGPPCNTVNQIPNLKFIRVRFVGKRNESPTSSGTALHDIDSHCTKLNHQSISSDGFSRAKSVFIPCKRKHEQPKASASSSPVKYPQSMSLSKVIKLGKLNVGKPTTVSVLYMFDVGSVVWSKVPTVVEFLEEKKPIGTGAFRNALENTQNLQVKIF